MNARQQHASTGRFARPGLATVVGLVAIAAVWVNLTHAQTPKTDPQPPNATQPAPAKPGVSVNDPKAFQGYTLLAPMNSTTTYLLDMEGRVVKQWESEVTPGLSAYLLENGHLLRAGNLGTKGQHQGAGQGGRVQEFDWDGNLVWDYTHSTKTQQQHHDIHKMPNGNVLMIVWDKKTAEEAVAAGRRPDAAKDGVLADAIIEVKPTGKTTGEVVWEWHAWDHLVQDHDKTKANYGTVAQKPELIDLNFGSGMLANMMANKDDLAKFIDLGYVGGGTPPPGKAPPGSPAGFGGPTTDWLHTNSVSYNADLDQIVVSVHAFSEIWIIDHSTTSAEAAGHSGGRYGKGGDLLYRWGNPKAYRAGSNADQRLFNQHDAHWIPKGLPGAGNMLVFNNGNTRPGGAYSSVDEIVLPTGADGNYPRKPGLPFGPDKPAWSYTAEKKTDFFALFISGAHRLPNGNTLICSGPDSTVFEVTAEKKVVWKFAHPVRGPVAAVTFGLPASPGQVLPPFVHDQFNPSDEQKQHAAEPRTEIDEMLEKVFGDDQKLQLKGMTVAVAQVSPPPTGPAGSPAAGALFRSYRYGPDFPGLAGKELKPGKKLEELLGAKN